MDFESSGWQGVGGTEFAARRQGSFTFVEDESGRVQRAPGRDVEGDTAISGAS